MKLDVLGVGSPADDPLLCGDYIHPGMDIDFKIPSQVFPVASPDGFFNSNFGAVVVLPSESPDLSLARAGEGRRSDYRRGRLGKNEGVLQNQDNVTAFERALLCVRAGSEGACEIYFDRNPDVAFEALEQAGLIPPPEPEFRYRMTVAGHLPGMFRCTRENIDDTKEGRC